MQDVLGFASRRPKTKKMEAFSPQTSRGPATNPARVSARFCLLSRGVAKHQPLSVVSNSGKIMVLLVLYVVLVYLHHSSDPLPPPVVRPPPCLSVVHPCVCAPSSDRSALPTSPLHPNAPLPRSAYLCAKTVSCVQVGVEDELPRRPGRDARGLVPFPHDRRPRHVPSLPQEHHRRPSGDPWGPVPD